MKLDKDGYEIYNDDDQKLGVPLQVPTLRDKIRQLIISEQDLQNMKNGPAETWEEANDFDIGDDEELKSEYEIDDPIDPELYTDPSPEKEAPKNETESKAEQDPKRDDKTETNAGKKEEK